jgi:hypothetical protein
MTVTFYVLATELGQVIWRPIGKMFDSRARRWAGGISPTLVAARGYCDILAVLYGARGKWTNSKVLRRVIFLIRRFIRGIPMEVRSELRFATASSHDRWWFGVGVNEVCSTLKGHERAILDTVTEAQYRAIADRMAAEAAELLTGAWPAGEDNLRVRWATKAMSVMWRAIPALLMTGLAVALPHLPGIDKNFVGISGIQVGLVVAAGASLVTRDSNLVALLYSTVRDAGKSKE